MNKYPKIETLFNRNDKFKVIEGDFRLPEYAIINRWLITEKIEGTNIRLWFTKGEYKFAGRTDKAEFTVVQNAFLHDLCLGILPAVESLLEAYGLTSMTVFGELYGPKIQAGGNYSRSLEFRIFDIQVNDSKWLDQTQLNVNATVMGLDTAPILGVLSTQEAIEFAKTGFKSTFALNPEYDAEGIVAKPLVPLYDNKGQRVMWKLKARDF
jgi:ATP-dependent RNA circularization protein (DNA/RNA ligase family)